MEPTYSNGNSMSNEQVACMYRIAEELTETGEPAEVYRAMQIKETLDQLGKLLVEYNSRSRRV